MMRTWSKNGLYWTCPDCGSNLDPGERCDCRDKAVEALKKKSERRGRLVVMSSADVDKKRA